VATHARPEPITTNQQIGSLSATIGEIDVNAIAILFDTRRSLWRRDKTFSTPPGFDLLFFKNNLIREVAASVCPF
jgi:hypothetical protein